MKQLSATGCKAPDVHPFPPGTLKFIRLFPCLAVSLRTGDKQLLSRAAQHAACHVARCGLRTPLVQAIASTNRTVSVDMHTTIDRYHGTIGGTSIGALHTMAMTYCMLLLCCTAA